MSSSKDSALYGFHRQKRMRGDKEISSNTALSFTSQLSSLINTSSNPSTTSTRPKKRQQKEDIFTTHNRNTAKRAKRDGLDSPAFATQQKHTTNGETLDRGLWERSKRKMEEKARLYAAMKRGDVEDEEGKYGVDFDRKWAEGHEGMSGEEGEDDKDFSDEGPDEKELLEYTDEFGRTRTGTRAQATAATRIQNAQADITSDRFTARPVAPSNVIVGDTIQHQAFNPDAKIEEAMEQLAKKRDRSLTPPPDVHFDADAEVRTKGTGFFQFSGDAGERKRQMEELEEQREETERVRRERARKEADEFLEDLARQMGGGGKERNGPVPASDSAVDVTEDRGRKGTRNAIIAEDREVDAMDAMQRIEAALAREKED